MIPDDAIAYVVGYGETTVGAIRQQEPEYITTEQAEALFSYRKETWAGWARDGLIEGARFDRMWRLPPEACRAHVRRLTSPVRRPRARSTSTSAPRAWAASFPAR